MASAEAPRTLPTSTTLRIEDFLLALWIAVAAPLLVASGHFRFMDTGRPLEGLVILASVAAALLVFITPTREAPGAGRSMGAFVGPLSGGVILVGASGFAALGAPEGWTLPLVVAGIAAVVLARIRVGTLPPPARRALVTPFVLVSGSIFWSLVDAVIGSGGSAGLTAGELRDALVHNTPGAGAVALVLLAAAAVYYAMLVYAPRQIADGEGSGLAWLARFGLFVASVLFGVGWLNALGL